MKPLTPREFRIVVWNTYALLAVMFFVPMLFFWVTKISGAPLVLAFLNLVLSIAISAFFSYFGAGWIMERLFPDLIKRLKVAGRQE